MDAGAAEGIDGEVERGVCEGVEVDDVGEVGDVGGDEVVAVGGVGGEGAGVGDALDAVRGWSAMRSLARFSIHLVAVVSAGPPLGGLYLKPPSSGGLCEGVMTMPSARLAWRVRSCR